jgi:hypothetical protein
LSTIIYFQHVSANRIKSVIFFYIYFFSFIDYNAKQQIFSYMMNREIQFAVYDK